MPDTVELSKLREAAVDEAAGVVLRIAEEAPKLGVTNTTAGSSTTIVNSTIADNFAQNGGGGFYAGSPVSLSNTILAANTVQTGATVDCQDASGGEQASDGPSGHNLAGPCRSHCAHRARQHRRSACRAPCRRA